MTNPMKRMLTCKLGLLFGLLFNSLVVPAITFDVQVLKDVQQSNFTQFKDPRFNPSSNFEIIPADFNGDGIDDML